MQALSGRQKRIGCSFFFLVIAVLAFVLGHRAADGESRLIAWTATLLAPAAGQCSGFNGRGPAHMFVMTTGMLSIGFHAPVEVRRTMPPQPHFARNRTREPPAGYSRASYGLGRSFIPCVPGSCLTPEPADWTGRVHLNRLVEI